MGLGIRDVSLASLIVMLGVPVVPAVTAATIERIVITVPYFVGGVIATHILGKNVINLKIGEKADLNNNE